MNFQPQNGVVRVSRLRLAESEVLTRGADPVRVAWREVARENHASRVMGPQDARWELALEVEESIEGGRAAIIRPEVRRRLVTRATERGLRPFDANLVIAVVQEGARRGERASVGRLAVVGPARERARPVSLMVGAVALGLAAALALVAWVVG
ncbi:MAG TPA: hypothetical protein VD997_01165 [Phycisphaerales bacterium]|nr:hypothetical protein [Phycisphaerales bacterium]